MSAPPWQIGCAVLAVAAIGGIVYINVNRHLANQLNGEETYPISGDVTHFDPYAALPDIRAKLGHDAHLTKIAINGVRADGTIDLNQSTEPLPKATYTFFYKVDKGPADGPPPAGSGTNAMWLQEVDVECYLVGQHRYLSATGRQTGYNNEGMDFRRPDVKAGVLPADIGNPKGSIKEFFTAAEKGGQDPNGSADVLYDSTGYRLYRGGTSTYFNFNSAGELQP